MDGERRRRIEELFHRAAELPAGSRTEYLQNACAGDDALRDEVESLVNALDGSGEFLEKSPAVADGEPFESVERTLIGREIGSYKIDRFISEGGMGYVYKASQASPRRDVAIKIMKGDALSPGAAKRFLYESEILARLRHPNIAHVYEAGMCSIGASRVPYFAMEFLEEAAPITQFAAGAKLTVREKLALFLQVCDAVQHGHQKGIIHLDLKPSNILVDLSGNVKVIDFGIAKTVDADGATISLLTQPARVAGTIAYMSPEQCDGDPRAVDVRGDIYSLGVVLYQLVCGALPYDVSTQSWMGAAKIVKESPPKRPRIVNSSVGEDLETIILKSLNKDPALRYQTAGDFRRDVERFIRNEPIEARAPSFLYRTKKFAGRNKTVSTLAFILIISILTFCVWIAILYAQSESRRLEVIAQQTKTEQYYQSLRNIIMSILSRPDEAGAPREATSNEILETMANEVRTKIKDGTRAELLYFLGMEAYRQKIYESARDLLLDSIRCDSVPEANDVQREAARVYLGNCYLHCKDFEKAVAQIRDSARYRGFNEDGSHKNTDLYLFALEVERKAAVAVRDFAAAKRLHLEKLEIIRKFQNNPYLYRSLPFEQLYYSLFLKTAGDFPEARRLLEENIQLISSRGNATGPNLFSTKNALASIYFRTERYEEARKVYEDLLSSVAEHSDPPAFELVLKNHLALVRGAAGDYKSSIELFEKNIENQIRHFGAAHIRVGQAYYDRATIHYQFSHYKEAEADARAAFEIYKNDDAPDRAEFTGAILHLLGRVELANKNLDGAKKLFDESIARYATWVPNDNFQIAGVEQSLGEYYLMIRNKEKARELFVRSSPPIEKAYGAKHSKTVEARKRAEK